MPYLSFSTQTDSSDTYVSSISVQGSNFPPFYSIPVLVSFNFSIFSNQFRIATLSADSSGFINFSASTLSFSNGIVETALKTIGGVTWKTPLGCPLSVATITASGVNIGVSFQV